MTCRSLSISSLPVALAASICKHVRATFLATLALALIGAVPAKAGLIFDTTFDSTVTSNPNAAQYEAAFTDAEALYSTDFNNNITINLTMALTPGTSTLGESSTNLQGYDTYSQVRTALISDYNGQTNINLTSAVTSLGTTDPTSGTQANFVIPFAQAKALGLRSATDPATDGTITFGSGFTYAFNPANRAVAGAYDFIGVAEHEISEVMGRISGLGTNFGNGVPDYMPYDLFRYTASGTRNLTNGNNIYFSINNGATNLKNYNFPNGNGSDAQDWASGTNDSYNAFSNPGVENDVTGVDVTTMAIVGYDVAPVPEARQTTAMLLGGLVLLAFQRRLRQLLRR